MDLNYSKLENSPIGEQIISNFKAFLDSVSKLINSIAPDYDATKTYAVGDYCVNDFRLYRCTTEVTTAEEFDSAKWTEVHVVDEMSSGSSSGSGSESSSVDLSNVLSCLAEPYDEDKANNGKYQLGNYVIKDNKFMVVSNAERSWDEVNNKELISYEFSDACLGDAVAAAAFMSYGYPANYYDPAKTYSNGDLCTYKGGLYRCYATTTTGDFNTNDWSLKYLSNDVFLTRQMVTNTYNQTTSSDAIGGTYRYQLDNGLVVKESVNTSNWKITDATHEIAMLYRSLIDKEFSTSDSYKVGDYVIGYFGGRDAEEQSMLMKCIMAGAGRQMGSPSNTSYFKPVKVADELRGIRSRFDGFVIKEVVVDFTENYGNRASLTFPRTFVSYLSHSLSDIKIKVDGSNSPLYLLSAECQGSDDASFWQSVPIGDFSDGSKFNAPICVWLYNCGIPSDTNWHVMVREKKYVPKYIRLLVAYKPYSSVEVNEY